MKVLSLHHVPFEGLGSLEEMIRGGGHHLRQLPMWTNPPLPEPKDFDLLIVMGGPMSIGDTDSCPWLSGEKKLIADTVAAGRRVLGICLGGQLLAEALGAAVAPGQEKEIGWFPVRRHPDAAGSAIGRQLPEEFMAFHWHGDAFEAPGNSVVLASSPACPVQGFSFEDRCIGLQFHLETTRKSAEDIVANGAADLAGSGTFIQSAGEILSPPGGFGTILPLMRRIWLFLSESS